MSSSSIPFDGSVAGISSLIAVFAILTTGTITLRFIARVKQRLEPGIDDWLAIIPVLCFLVFFCLGVYGMAKGFVGQNAPTDPNEVLPPSETEKVFWVTDLVSVIALGTIRLSAILFYRRVFCTGRRDVFSILTIIMIVIIVIWTIGFIIAALLNCDNNPYYIFYPPKDFCKGISWLYALAWSSVILDLLVIIMPIPKIWQLHTDAGRKISIAMVFLLAGAGLAASLARAIIFYLIVTHNAAALHTSDFYVRNTKSIYYQFLEVGLGATAINLPSLWYFSRGARPDRVIRSLLSLVSLRSTGSASSKKDQTQNPRRKDSAGEESESQTNHTTTLRKLHSSESQIELTNQQ